VVFLMLSRRAGQPDPTGGSQNIDDLAAAKVEIPA
jgi:hypothetical protein